MHNSPARKIRSSSGGEFKMLIGFAVLWNLIAFSAAGVLTPKLPKELADGNYAALLVYVFPAIGLLLVGWVVRSFLHERRFGNTELTLDPYPGAIGGQLGGEISLPTRLPPDTRFDVTAQCLLTQETRNSKGQKSSRTSVIWQEDMQGRASAEGEGLLIRFLFDVPAGLPVSESRSSRWHHWKLAITADVPGVDLDATFEIPMQQGTARSSLELPGLAREMQRLRAEKLVQILNVEQRDDTLYLDFPYGRGKTSALVLFAAGIIFGGAGLAVGIAESGHGVFSLLPMLMSAIFVFIGSMLVAAGLYIPFNHLAVAISPSTVFVRRRWAGFLVVDKQIPVDAIRALKIERRGSVSNGRTSVTYFRIVAMQDQGRKLCLVEDIPGQSLAEEAERFLRSQTALSVVAES